MSSFSDLGLSDNLDKALKKQEITIATQVQTEVIPKALAGRDLIIRSKTGSGKTLAYLLPIFERINLEDKHIQAIIITPTHELAYQVYKEGLLLERDSDRSVGLLLAIGQANINRQIEKLKEKPHIVIGSSGRILDLIKRRKLVSHFVKTIVLDEGDRLTDDKNFSDIEAIVKTTMRDRQILLLSATVLENTLKAAKELMKGEREIIFSKTNEEMPSNLEHYYILTTLREKFLEIRKVLASFKGSKAIIFINNPENIEVTVEKLIFHGFRAGGIYLQAGKLDRKNSMQDFREGRIDVLVSSDIGARGLDIDGLNLVINLDFPLDSSAYLHRGGRCGRMGREGWIITLVTPKEYNLINKISKEWRVNFTQKEMSKGRLVDSKKTVKDLNLFSNKNKNSLKNNKKILSKSK